MSFFGGKKKEARKGTAFAVTPDYVRLMIDTFKAQKTLPKAQVKALLNQAFDYYKKLPNILDITIPEDGQLTICGDTHGQYYDVLNLFRLHGYPAVGNPYLFNGDIVDRGSFGCENALTLIAMQLALPTSMYVLRGNHESEACTMEYGFHNEVLDKYDASIYGLFMDVFRALPIGATINKKAFVAHGGLFKNLDVTIAELQKVRRFTEPGFEGGERLMAQLLWSDPMPEPGIREPIRPYGCRFGPNVTKYFLELNKMSILIRSHEMKPLGYEVEHDRHLITIFSAPNYCNCGNRGAFLVLKRQRDRVRKEKEHYAKLKRRYEQRKEKRQKKAAAAAAALAGGSGEEKEKKEGEDGSASSSSSSSTSSEPPTSDSTSQTSGAHTSADTPAAFQDATTTVSMVDPATGNSTVSEKKQGGEEEEESSDLSDYSDDEESIPEVTFEEETDELDVDFNTFVAVSHPQGKFYMGETSSCSIV